MWLSLDEKTGNHHIARQIGWQACCGTEVHKWIDSDQIKGEVKLCPNCCDLYPSPRPQVSEYRRGFRSPGVPSLNADGSVNTDRVLERLTPTIEEQIEQLVEAGR